MTHLNLDDIRRMNDKRLDGYWRRTIAALCDRIEALQRLQVAVATGTMRSSAVTASRRLKSSYGQC